MSTFSLDLLRWSKIIICTDADVDGFQIRTLILTMLYRLTPTLIDQGYVYIAETPLYEISTKSDTYFAYNDREKNEIIAEIGKKKHTINRSNLVDIGIPGILWADHNVGATNPWDYGD